MHSPRSTVAALAKLLDAAREPALAFERDARVVFANEAALAWLDLPREALLGTQARYCPAEELTGPAAAAARVCPPPEAFLGRAQRAVVCVPRTSAAESPIAHELFYHPLSDERGEVHLVLALAAPTGLEPAAAPDPPPLDLHAQWAALRQRFPNLLGAALLAGDSPQSERLRQQVALAAAGPGHVYLQGGAQRLPRLHARAIHFARPQAAAGGFAALACAGLNAELLQAAVRSVCRAPGGQPPVATLFLEDLAALSPEAQRELQGFLALKTLALKVVASADVPPGRLSAGKGFSPELAAALTPLVLELPGLAERRRDVPLLIQALVEEHNAQGGRQLAGFSVEALEQLAAYAWPGDLAELVQLVAGCCAQAAGPAVTRKDLPRTIGQAQDAAARPARGPEPVDVPALLADLERELLQRALTLARGNKTKAAQLVCMQRNQFYRRLVHLGLELPIFRPTDEDQPPRDAASDAEV